MSYTDTISVKLATMNARIKREVELQIKRELSRVQLESSTNHRYQSRSGMLNKAYRIEVSGYHGRIRLTKQETATPYAWAIHSGRKDWPRYVPDLFLYKAGEKRKPYIIDGIKRAVRRATSGK